ncbi:MAG TPA: amidohydrolase family protein [Thermoanaerobaculia bacterium]|nr:amidohydrolase family protein [Thermoanaerobaculia bacterium]
MRQDNPVPLLLSGRIVYSDGSARQRYVLVRDGRIVWVGVGRPPAVLAAGAREIVTGPRGWIFPGLINLHTHSTYNVLPLWHSRKAPFTNRFEWRGDPDYRADISGRLDELRKVEGSQLTLAVVSELQAIAGGTSVLDQSNRLDANAVEHEVVLCRDTGDPTDIGLPADRRIDSIVDFFTPDGGKPAPKKNKQGEALIDGYAQARDAGKLGAVLVHLAEGRSGFGSGRGVDPYSRAEFEAFLRHPAVADPERVRAVPLNLVHACGLDVHDDAHLEFLRERNISVIWSPVSNLLLYGDTLDAERLLQGGVNLALGSDWSPSGSKHVWDEAKFARRFLDAIGSTVCDADVFRMVTLNAARCLGSQQLGRIEEGAFADMFIVESPIDSDSALEVFFSTDDRHVLATIINGLPIYGRRSFLEQFDLPLQSLPAREGSAAKDKAVFLPTHLEIDLGTALDEIEDRLKKLERPALRSNLLASSDKPYQRRIQRLRGEAELFGWSVKQTARRLARGEPPMKGLVPVAPDAVQVRCGFAAGADRERYLDRLGSVVAPSTVMVMRTLGLTAYVLGVPPADHAPACPDEVAILFYESREACAASESSVGGRLNSLLQEPVAGADPKGSWSAFPVPLASPLRSRTAYHLFTGPVDWHGGLTRLCVGLRDASRQDVEAFHDGLHRVCAGLAADPRSVDGALLAVDDDYFVFWDHRAEARPEDDRHLGQLAALGTLILNAQAADQNANGQLFETWAGFPLQGGECLRMRFERRAFFPW